MGQYQLLLEFEKACDAVRTQVLYNILTEFGIPMKLVQLIKMSSNKIYSKVYIKVKLPLCFN
jgi:hypothetical protein